MVNQVRYRRPVTLLVLTLLVLTTASCTAAVVRASDDWVSLGSASVKPNGDYDVIRVNKTATYDKLQLRVSLAPVVFKDVKVHYVGGGVQDIKIGQRLPAGGRSRVIDLRGNDRHIDKITFWYQTPRKVKRFGRVTAFARR